MRDTIYYAHKTIKMEGKIIDLNTPVVMGIINVTPDSFYEGSRYISATQVVSQALRMYEDGATIIDIGGYSTRPHAEEVPEKEEIRRVTTTIKYLKKEMPNALISIDTFRAVVAEAAILEGASMVNDISGGQLDEQMLATVAKYQVPYVLMHSRGTPQTMMQLTTYDSLLLDILTYFHQKLALLRQYGIRDVVIDVGFGFAKTIAQNFELMKNLSYFQILNLPLMAGISRKSMIWKTLETTPAEALNGTTALNTWALLQGASILRVHDVRPAVEVVKLLAHSKK
jgi:dihydropteroate synthase